MLYQFLRKRLKPFPTPLYRSRLHGREVRPCGRGDAGRRNWSFPMRYGVLVHKLT